MDASFDHGGGHTAAALGGLDVVVGPLDRAESPVLPAFRRESDEVVLPHLAVRGRPASRRTGWSRDSLENDLWPVVRNACGQALADVGFTQRRDDRFEWKIRSGMTGIVALRPPLLVPSRGGIEVVATCGLRLTELERVYDEVATAAELRWYVPDQYRHSFYTGFSEVWEFRAETPPEPAAERLGIVIWTEALAVFQAFQTVDDALRAIVNQSVMSRFACEQVPIALMLLGRFDEARRYVAAAPSRFACVEDADHYRRFTACLEQRLG